MFVSRDVSMQLIKELQVVMPTIAKFDRNLADQLRRAATSVHLNLGEGARRRDGDRRRHYEMAHGSAGEVKAGLEIADAWGMLREAPELLEILDRLLGLLWGLTHARKER